MAHGCSSAPLRESPDGARRPCGIPPMTDVQPMTGDGRAGMRATAPPRVTRASKGAAPRLNVRDRVLELGDDDVVKRVDAPVGRLDRLVQRQEGRLQTGQLDQQLHGGHVRLRALHIRVQTPWATLKRRGRCWPADPRQSCTAAAAPSQGIEYPGRLYKDAGAAAARRWLPADAGGRKRKAGQCGLTNASALSSV